MELCNFLLDGWSRFSFDKLGEVYVIALSKDNKGMTLDVIKKGNLRSFIIRYDKDSHRTVNRIRPTRAQPIRRDKRSDKPMILVSRVEFDPQNEIQIKYESSLDLIGLKPNIGPSLYI